MLKVDLVEEALRLIDAAEKRRIVLRLMGAGAVRKVKKLQRIEA